MMMNLVVNAVFVCGLVEGAAPMERQTGENVVCPKQMVQWAVLIGWLLVLYRDSISTTNQAG